MGDRVLVTFTDDDGESYSPAVYLHWCGSEAAAMIREAAPVLRKGDSSYAAGRFCGFCCDQLKRDPLGVGILPGPTPDDIANECAQYSHGDAGVYLVNVNTGKVLTMGGYGEPFEIDPAKFYQL